VVVIQKQSAPANRLKWRPGLAIFAVLAMLWLNLLFFVGFRESMKRAYTDFSVFYTAGTILRQGLGHELYNRQVQFRVQEDFAGHLSFRHGPLPYIHPPFEAPIFLPLSFLPYAKAIEVWDLLSLGMLFGVAAVLQRSVAMLRATPLWKFVLVSLTFFPVFVCFLQGQDSILQLLLCALAYSAMKRKADVLAGCWLALAAFKFQFTIPIVLLFFLWKRRKVALGFSAVGVLLVLASVAIVGLKAMLDYPAFILRIVNSSGLGGVPLSLLPNLHGLARGWPGPFSGLLGIALAVASSIALFAFAAVKGHAPAPTENLELQFSLAVMVSGLIAWQTNAHDLGLLLIALVLVADYCLAQTPKDRAPNFSLLLPVSPLLISPLWMVLWFGIGHVNLVVIPLLWWSWRIGRELTHTSQPQPVV
jgi:hypothetical protein